jgi:hypothetical protein
MEFAGLPIKINRYPMVMKNIALIFIFIILATPLRAATKPTLIEIERENGKDTTELRLTFDMLPKFSIKQSGKRVDLILEEAIVADSSLDFSVDDRIVKFLPLVSEEQTKLSFFLRYIPERARIIPGKDNSLILQIDLGHEFSKTRTDMMPGSKKTTKILTAEKDFTNPLVATPFAHDWRLFFTRYESDVSIKAPVHYTLPPFPVVGMLPPDKEKNLLLIPPDLNELASTGQWNAMEPVMANLLKNEHDLEKKKLLALTYGEILVRAGNFSGAYKQLYLLEHAYPDQPISFFAKFLLAILEAEFEDPYIGDYKLHELELSLEKDSPVVPYFYLLQIEMALATNQLKKMKSFLDRDDILLPEKISKIKELRQADYWFASNNTVKAYVRYQLLNDPALIEHHPYSLNGFCDTLYQQKLFQESAQCYQKLSRHITDKNQLGMVGYRKAMSEFHYKQQYEMITEFSTLEDAFPGTDAGYKAAIKKTDIRFLTKKNWETGSARSYRIIAEKATARSTAEEAALKEALIYRIMGKNEKSIELLMAFLRNFRTGNLIETAQAVVIDILPGELQRLVQKEEYVKALVLAKQNKMFFEKNWLDIELLGNMAIAYQQLNLFEEAKNLYHYLIEVGGAKAEEKYLPPFINALFRQGQYSAVDDFAAQYSTKYPHGKDSEQILYLRLQALRAKDNIGGAISLLPAPLPDALQMQELAATLYFQKNDFQKTAEILVSPWENKKLLSEHSRFILAESLYKQGSYEKAEELFSSIQESPRFQDQSLFRLADIQLKKGQEEKAVKLFQQIVEKGKDPLWQNLAKKELEYSAISKKL